MRYLRLDDFPRGHPGMLVHTPYRDLVGPMLDIFEEEGVPYILGVSPLLFQEPDVAFLNEHIKLGRACLHGFDHHFGSDQWDYILATWPDGGEFAHMSVEKLQTRLGVALSLCKDIDRFTQEHFIPPFNVFNQELLDVLAMDMPQCKWMHTCDQEWNAYNQANLDYHGITPVVSVLSDSYHHVDGVIKNLQAGEAQGQITLHWMFDTTRLASTWRTEYRKLAKFLIEEDERIALENGDY